MKRKISDLKHHPEQKNIYPVSDEAVESMAENIAQVGLLEPCLISKDGFIVSGYTRIAALTLLGKKTVECKVIDIPEDQFIYYLISSNKQRVKNYVVRLAEVDALTKYYSKGQGNRTDLDEGLTRSKHTGRRKTTVERVAADLGISTHTIQKLKFIRSRRPDLLEYAGETITLQALYFQVKMWYNQKAIIEAKESKKKKAKYSGKGFTIYRKPAEKMLEVLTEESIDVVVTSPPYYDQRVYSDASTELGQEKTVNDYIYNLIKIFELCKRVMKPTSSFYLNMGDTYIDGGKAQIPERVSIAIADQLGLVLRNTLIWEKPHYAPESTKRRRHTNYEHIFHFVKDRKAYFYDADPIRIPYNDNAKAPIIGRSPRHYTDMTNGVNARWVANSQGGAVDNLKFLTTVDGSIKHPAGKIPGSILRYNSITHPIKDADIQHTAPFRPEMIRELLLPVVTDGSVVMDPFSGSGSAGVAALELGAEYVGFEISNVFAEQSQDRLNQVADWR